MNRTVFRVLLCVLAIAVVWAPARAWEPSRDNVPMRPAVNALTPTHLSSVDANSARGARTQVEPERTALSEPCAELLSAGESA